MNRKTKSLLAITAAIVIAGVAIFHDWVDWHGLRQSLESMERGPLLALVAVLPLFGFSIAAVYLVVGAVFGGWLGMAVVAGITAIHLLGSHWIGRSVLRAPLQRFLQRRKQRLPEVPDGEEWAVALTTALVPGLPYFVRNYLLAVSDIPLRTYFWICGPIYVLRSSVVIFLGDFSGDISVRRVVILGSVLLVKVAVCAYLIQRLRARYKARSARIPEDGTYVPGSITPPRMNPVLPIEQRLAQPDNLAVVRKGCLSGLSPPTDGVRVPHPPFE